ncbi:alpha-actinin A [Biomphalaria pfeifferi]|uniref:Alpha-actinin A n=1 Tax=Biomphalaria pfeifferi TaxID=112525 RepID=A0AAD8CCC1_BIOPF|nr:alpha-actinin A [Biomphalaria pfeifferi]
MDLKDLCLSADAYEGNSRLDYCIQRLSMNCTCGASHREFRCQENQQQGICTSAIIIDIGIDECQSIQVKSELAGRRHSKLELEETYLLDVRLLGEGDCGALDFVCNVAGCELAAPLRAVCRESLLRQRVRSTAVLKKTIGQLEKEKAQMASWETGTLPFVAPTDRPPPEQSNLHGTVSFRDEKR